MNREQMLKKLGLSEGELRDLLEKQAAFEKTLNTAQRKVVSATSPTLAQIATFFSPTVTEKDVRAFLEKTSPVAAVILSNYGRSEQ